MDKDFSKYLLEEHPITFHSTLACAIGLNEAILLQKMNLWLNCKPHDINGKSWIYNTCKSWQDQLPFLSESTIKRAIKNLFDKDILIKSNFNKSKFDHTNWYSINYEKVDEVVDNYKKLYTDNIQLDEQEQVQLDIIDSVNLTSSQCQFDPTYTNDYNTMNTNIEKENIKEKENFEKFYSLYPRKVGKANVEKWFTKNKPSEELMKIILNSLEEHKKLKQWQDKQYIPHPTTWLNQKRWEDDLSKELKVSRNDDTERRYNDVSW